MQYFNESAPYWGDSLEKYDNGRLIARSVKMFADGMFLICFSTKAPPDGIVTGALRTAGAAVIPIVHLPSPSLT